jgi:hypothetical protein
MDAAFRLRCRFSDRSRPQKDDKNIQVFVFIITITR